MQFQFVAMTDDEMGTRGWLDSRIADDSPYGPQVGFGLAHDCLEHFKLETVADEIMAHGAMYWIRYLGGWHNVYGAGLSLDAFGWEWSSLMRAMMDGYNLPFPRRTRRLDKETEDDISQIVVYGRRNIRAEFESAYLGGHNWRQLTDYLENCFRGWFRMGYRRAAKRYGKMGINSAEASHLFQRLAERFEKEKPEFEGEKLTVQILEKGNRIVFYRDEIHYR